MERLLMSDRLRIMILEDDHNRINSFKTILELQVQDVSYHLTADSFIKTLSKEKFVDCIMLDHDLGGKTFVDTGDRNTGSEVARYIIKNRDDATDWRIGQDMVTGKKMTDGNGYYMELNDDKASDGKRSLHLVTWGEEESYTASTIIGQVIPREKKQDLGIPDQREPVGREKQTGEQPD